MQKILLVIISAFASLNAYCELEEIDIENVSSKEKNSDPKGPNSEGIEHFIAAEIKQIDSEERDSHEQTNNVVEVTVEDTAPSISSQRKKNQACIEIQSAVIQFVNQNSAVHKRKKIRVGEEYTFERIKVSLKKCFMSAPGEPLCVWAYLVVSELENAPNTKQYKEIFSGWMLSSNPSANTLENDTYDVKVESDADE